MMFGLVSSSPMERDPHGRDPHGHGREFDAGVLGMVLLLVTLGIVFVGSLVVYVLLRHVFRPDVNSVMPGISWSMWLATALLVLSSYTMHRALQFSRSGNSAALWQSALATTVLGIGFLVLQCLTWAFIIQSDVPIMGNHGTYLYFVLPALHGAHVIGGLIPLGIVTARARLNYYTPQRRAGVVYCAMYWHFLDAVWLVMFAVMLSGV